MILSSLVKARGFLMRRPLTSSPSNRPRRATANGWKSYQTQAFIRVRIIARYSHSTYRTDIAPRLSSAADDNDREILVDEFSRNDISIYRAIFLLRCIFYLFLLFFLRIASDFFPLSLLRAIFYARYFEHAASERPPRHKQG